MKRWMLAVMMAFGVSNAWAGGTPPLFESISKGDAAAVARQASDPKAATHRVGFGHGTAVTPLCFAVMTPPQDGRSPKAMVAIARTLLQNGADANTICSLSGVEASAIDIETMMSKNGVGSDAMLALLKQYGGRPDAKRVAAYDESYKRYRLKAHLVACSSDARNWQMTQELYYSDHARYPASATSVPDSIVMSGYHGGGSSFSASVYCKADPERRAVSIDSKNPFAGFGRR